MASWMEAGRQASFTNLTVFGLWMEWATWAASLFIRAALFVLDLKILWQ